MGAGPRRQGNERRPAPAVRSARVRSGGGESGVAIVEFAIVVPLLLLLLFGMIDFGLVVYRAIGLAEGVRDSARQGAVAVYDGNVAACTGGSPTTELVCLAKQRVGVSGVAIHVIAPSNTVGAAFAVCATYKSAAITGLTQPFLPKYLHSETVMRLEQAPTGGGLTTGGDSDPEGNSWSSCKAPT